MAVPLPVSVNSPILSIGGGEAVRSALAAAGAGEIRRIGPSELGALNAAAADAIVVLCDSEPAYAAELRALRATDGLPLWAVLEVSENGTGSGLSLAGLPPAVLTWALRQTQEFHRLRRQEARLRGDMLTYGSRISHDLRSPLGGVLTTTEMLREVLADDAPNDVALTDPIVESAEGLVRLIERTSFFAKAIAAPIPLQRLSMGTALWNASQQLESRIVRAGATLTQPSEWPEADGVMSWCESIWRNLIANALEHGGAQVRMEAGWNRDGDFNRFWLWSSGPVAKEKQPFLFFPFQRLNEASAPRGLGLPIVRRLVEMLHGRCGFEVPPRGGALFHFSLPTAGPDTGDIR